MATFITRGETASQFPTPDDPYITSSLGGAPSIPDDLYRRGDRVVLSIGGIPSTARLYTFHGYEQGTGNVVLAVNSGTSFVMLFRTAPGTDPITGSERIYRPTGDIITNDPVGFGVYRFADWGQSTSGDPATFTSRGQTIEFDRDIYRVGDTLTLTIRGGQPATSTTTGVFVGRDRNTGGPIFAPVNDDGSRIIAATDKQATYEVPAKDIVAKPWPPEATFTNYGFRQGDLNAAFDLQGTGLISGLNIQDGAYRVGDTLTIWPQRGTAGGEPVEVTYLGLVTDPDGRYPVFEADNFRNAGRAQFIGTRETGSGTYTPGSIDTTATYITGVASFEDYGARVGTSDTFNSQNREVEFNQNFYEPGDIVTLRIIRRAAYGIPTVERTVRATFAGLDRETGNPLFSNPRLSNGDDFGDGRQMFLASEEQTTYDVPLTDVVANDWPAVSAAGAEFANYGLRRENPDGDFEGDFNLLGVASFIGLDVASGLYDVGATLMIRPFGGVGDGEDVEVTVVGHVVGAGGRIYPVFEADDFGGSPAQLIGTRETGSGPYTPAGAIDTSERVGVGTLSFADYGRRRDAGNDLDVFNSQNREIEFDRAVYKVRDIVQLRVIGYTGTGDDRVRMVENTFQARFAGVDRETGDPVFNPVDGGRQYVAASEEDPDGYDIPLRDIVTTVDWPVSDASGATFANYGFRRDFNGDFALQGPASFIGLGVGGVPPGVYDVGTSLMIQPFGGVGNGRTVAVTLVGHEESTNYPIFEAADFDGAPAQFIGTDAMVSGSYTPGTIVTDEPVGVGEITFMGYGQRLGTSFPADGEFRIQGTGLSFPHGTYNANDPVMINIVGFGPQSATFLGYERDTGYPVFHYSTLSRLFVGVDENLAFDAIYTVDDLVTDMPYMTCFAPGTLIATPDGERAVETLKPGDMVLTADGDTVPVRFVGFQKVPTMFGPKELTHPVRIRTGALGENTPHTDLVVTKDHGMIVDGVICHAGALINGTSIVEVPTHELDTGPSGIATYYHVETEGHVPLLANGAVAESFIDDVDRARFANHGEFAAMYGARVPAMTQMNLPRAMSARQVPPRIRTRLGLPEYDVTFIPAPVPSGVRGLWSACFRGLRDRVRSARRRSGAWLRGLGIA